jgi:hypothetical protein
MSLWRIRSFTLLWVAQAVSQLGTGVSTIAYPLIAWTSPARRPGPV